MRTMVNPPFGQARVEVLVTKREYWDLLKRLMAYKIVGTLN